MKKSYCVIHAHFYQPPRENAWTETIEIQPSAAPFHDWNEKITHECYRPNAMARIVDPRGRVLEMVNNFRMISFNVGSTLLSWLELSSPRTYHHIFEADRQSVKEHGGHGNAIAQVYNHMIMPLATERDKITQVRWGLYDFKKRFGREPEGMWLPETAANVATLRVLIAEKVKFTILAPHQAEKIRRIGSSDWQDVSHGDIDPTRPYRYFLDEDPKQFIDLFFYDGAISHEISFGDLAWDAKRLVGRLASARNGNRQHPELIHIATDGETYGHHKAFGDRVLAYAVKYEAHAQGFAVTNYGEYLEKFPPQYEVKIKPGKNHEGTSWSCAHGVGRWKENCGCQTGGQPGWNQTWRAPLRESFDLIRDRLYAFYEREAGKIFHNPWFARDCYIELILDRSENARKEFFKKFAVRSLGEDETIRALKLLEMERHAMLMYTSCGWFFADISGIETVQVIQYASRAVGLASELGETSLEEDWLAKLAAAKSNIPGMGEGRSVYEKFVKPSHMSPERVIHHVVLPSFFSKESKPSENLEEDFTNVVSHAYSVSEKRYWEGLQGDLNLRVGEVCYQPKAIPEVRFYLYAILRARFYEFLCAVRPLRDPREYADFQKEMAEALDKANEIFLIQKMDQLFGGEMFTLKDLLLEEKRKISIELSQQVLKRFYEAYEALYEDHREALEVFQEAKIPLPGEYQLAAEFVLNRRLHEAVKTVDWSTPRPDYKSALAVVEEANRWGFKLKSLPAADYLSGVLNQKVEKLSTQHGVRELVAIEQILKASSRLGLELHDRIAQDVFFLFLQDYLPRAFESYNLRKDQTRLREIRAMLHLGRRLGFNMDRFRRKIRHQAKVG